MNKIKPSMNERLKLLRKTLNLSMESFGKQLGVTKVTISRLEKGDNITEHMFIAICNTYNVNPDWLRYGKGEMFDITNDSLINLAKDYNLTETEIKLLTNYLCLDETKRKAIIEFMKNVF